MREITEACSRCVSTWIEARKADDFAAFAGPLRTVVALKRRQAEAIGGGDEPYDALLDEFEPGARAAELEPVFADLRERLTPLVAAASRLEAAELPPREWSEEGQMALAHDIAALVGFEEAAGVIARSAHPFTSSPHAGDVRFTTRLSRESPLSNIGAVMHELGHALYEQGLPADVNRTPLHDAPSLGAHESQSRFWENQIGHTLAFWEVLEPDLRRRFPEAMTGLDPMLMHRAAHVVRPSLIRVEADEVTYNLHIVLRFEMELALLRGELEVEDLPVAFADGMEQLLGIRPPATRWAPCRTSTGRTACSATSPPTRSATSTPPSSPRRPRRSWAASSRTMAEGRLGDVLVVHARAGAPPRRPHGDPRADARGDRARARPRRPDRAPGALLPGGLSLRRAVAGELVLDPLHELVVQVEQAGASAGAARLRGRTRQRRRR